LVIGERIVSQISHIPVLARKIVQCSQAHENIAALRIIILHLEELLHLLEGKQRKLESFKCQLKRIVTTLDTL
jgi:hypothetical protein